MAGGQVRDDLVSYVDLPPTTLALAGVPIPKYFQGQVFLGPNAVPPRDFVYVHRDRMDEGSDTIRRASSTARTRPPCRAAESTCPSIHLADDPRAARNAGRPVQRVGRARKRRHEPPPSSSSCSVARGTI
jgi:hypothetical protein